MTPPLRRGEFVTVRAEGAAPLLAMVGLASTNGRSVMVLFDGVLGGWVGAAALSEVEAGPDLETVGRFTSLDGLPVTIERGPQA